MPPNAATTKPTVTARHTPNGASRTSKAAKACALLSIVGCINVVIIKYSVEWWNMLHQPSSPPSLAGDSPNGPEFWIATAIMIVAVYLFLTVSLVLTTRNEILQRERRSQWVQDLVQQA